MDSNLISDFRSNITDPKISRATTRSNQLLSFRRDSQLCYNCSGTPGSPRGRRWVFKFKIHNSQFRKSRERQQGQISFSLSAGTVNCITTVLAPPGALAGDAGYSNSKFTSQFLNPKISRATTRLYHASPISMVQLAPVLTRNRLLHRPIELIGSNGAFQLKVQPESIVIASPR